MKIIISGIYILFLTVTVGHCQEPQQPVQLTTKIKDLTEDLGKEKEAKLTWENLVSYLRAEAKFWDTSSYVGRDVLFEGLVVGRQGNLLQIRDGGGLQGSMAIDSFVESSDNAGQYFGSDTTYVKVFGSIMSINENHQIFVKAKRIAITASQ